MIGPPPPDPPPDPTDTPDAHADDATDASAPPQPTVPLTDNERNLFTLLLAANDWAKLGQTIRVAGGWVRDKLLGNSTDDVDIVLDRMTGQQFVAHLRRYIDAHKAAGAGARGEPIPRGGLGRGYLVQQNIERSKHLETAGVALFGIKAEFVHLRSETYADRSRVPTVEFGDPLADAQRRDLTINAMFWRLDTHRVEDFVGGRHDLNRMHLRTPLEPMRTFIDDPLRVLRLVRFRARFAGSVIDDHAQYAMADPTVRDAYTNKVAPERAAAEVLKLFAGAEPGPALAALERGALLAAVFGIDALEHAPQGVGPLATQAAADDIRSASFADDDRALGAIAAFFFAVLRAAERADHDARRDAARALKRIGLGKAERAVVNAAMHGAAACERQPWDDAAMGELRLRTAVPGSDRGDVWRLAFATARAAATARSHGAAFTADEADRRREQMRRYTQHLPPLEPLLDGERIMQRFPDLDPRTGFIRDVHDRLVRRQLTRDVRTVADAERAVDAFADDVRAAFGRP